MENTQAQDAKAPTKGGRATVENTISNTAQPRPHRNGRSQGGRSGGRNPPSGKGRGEMSGRPKKADMGRGEWSRNKLDKRKRNDEEHGAKRRRIEVGGENGSPFSKEEIDAESRKPKRKVAVMIGYAGSGYKGMQINGKEKTIEGDIFKAFVAAGAISKANADDPKKSSLVRCARTDKGVHAAGNVMSLKLIVEDPDVVKNINKHLPHQIRIWGIERTNGSFSCYQTCDSRWYEYLIPTHSFLPPHPESFLAKKLQESAQKENLLKSYMDRQLDVASFWKEAEEEYVKPILEKLDPQLAADVMAAVHSSDEESNETKKLIEQVNEPPKAEDVLRDPSAGINERSKYRQGETEVKEELKHNLQKLMGENSVEETLENHSTSASRNPGLNGASSEAAKGISDGQGMGSDTPAKVPTTQVADRMVGESRTEDSNALAASSQPILTPFEVAKKAVKAAYITAKNAYRISSMRKDRVQEALDVYLGTRSFHNYTIQKRFSDPSAKRVIRSFNVGPEPIIINNTEWLSLKVHGQSFMMHQIRKMVAMAALVVRCGSSVDVIRESYGSANISIPKAPGLGLLLERPVFHTYNDRAVKEYAREPIDFDKYEKEIEEFKQKEIYNRIFREEARDHQFHNFFHHLDHYRSDYFLWVTASGITSAKQSQIKAENISDDDADVNGEEG